MEKIFEILEKAGITYDEYTENGRLCGYELNTYTPGGVNMIVFLDFRDGEREMFSEAKPITAEDFVREFANYILAFDMDEEIDLHRQDENYKKVFTTRDSVEDFEDWIQQMESLCSEMAVENTSRNELANSLRKFSGVFKDETVIIPNEPHKAFRTGEFNLGEMLQYIADMVEE